MTLALPQEHDFFPRLQDESNLVAALFVLSDGGVHIPTFRDQVPLDVIRDFDVEKIDSTVDFIREKISQQSEESFFVVELSSLVKQFRLWRRLLPRVLPYYAIKCNPDIAFIRILASLGAGFDCASKEEIRIVKECGVDASRIIYANPCKSPAHIVKAREDGVTKMTFDNLDELRKIATIHPEAQLVLRILPDDSGSIMKFGSKFGAPEDTWEELLSEASRLKLDVIGVSFHVGSGCLNPQCYANTLLSARKVFDLATRYGYEFTLLDIGGGFPGSTDANPSIFDIAAVVGPSVDELFPPHVQVISEPGRYFAEGTTTIVSSIHSRRSFVDGDSRKFKYYIGEGVYGSFNCIMFDHAHPSPYLIDSHSKDVELHTSTIFGPTCDSIDKVVPEILLPELAVGDWLYFANMGAYTCAAASCFNGFMKSKAFYVVEDGIDTSLS